MNKKKVLSATEGTGGHIFPAYSLANYLLKKNYNVEITTDKRGFKYLKDYQKIKLIKISSSPLNKKNPISLLISFFLIIFAILKSLLTLFFNRPSIIFGMGGYSSFPICIAASILKIKFIIYENNLIIGKANRYLLPFAKKIFVSYKELEGISKKYENKVFEIGNIVREEILNFSSDNNQIKKFEKIKILVLGGSQGAKIFDNDLKNSIVNLSKKKSIRIIQQTNKKNISYLSDFYLKNKIENRVFNFDKNFSNIICEADLCITRAGASTLSELSVLNIPFIAVPLPNSKDNHQFENANFYENLGCCWVMSQKDFNVVNLRKFLDYIIINKSEYNVKKNNLKKHNFQNS